MNILYILGNGFDLNLDLKTSYPSFYEFFKTQSYKSEWTKMLQEEITSKTNDWSDFEEEFGKFTLNFEKDVQEFIEVYSDIINSLSEYLLHQEKKIRTEDIHLDRMKLHLKNPTSVLEGRDRQILQGFMNQFTSSVRNIHIINFNYTSSLEMILGTDRIIELSNEKEKVQSKIVKISHIHGTLDKRMIVGVNDESQIHNPFFKNNVAVTSRILKQTVNNISKELVSDDCNSRIANANLIVIYGSSLGKTDKLWWERIIRRVKGGCKLIIFHYERKNINIRIPAERVEIENDVLLKLLKFSEQNEIELEKIKNDIHIVVNGRFMQGIKKVAVAS